MKRWRLAIELRLRSPFLFPAVSTAGFGLDAVALRDDTGRPLVPGDQVRGVLRHALERVRTAGGNCGDLAVLFGQRSADARRDAGDGDGGGAQFDPARGRILFADLAAPAAAGRARATRVRLEAATGAADPGGLLSVELVAPNGADVGFAGEAVLFATDAEAQTWLAALTAATTWVSAIGSMKSAGFGEVRAFSIEPMEGRPLMPSLITPVAAERRTYRLTIDRPFVVDARRDADNLYVGREVIPGGALKGLMARKLQLMGAAPEHDPAVEKLQISHAFPLGMTPALPLSLVVADGGQVGDALLVPQGRGALLAGQPARFMPDWKAQERRAVHRRLGLVEPSALRRTTRMHVAIDAVTGVAIDEQLFATNAVDPQGTTWQVDVDFSKIADGNARARLAAVLEDGLDGLGRTGASVAFERVATAPLPPVVATSGRHAVILVTDAAMASAADDDDALAAYAAYWARVCPGAALVNFFARQRLAGGYLARRYRAGESYAPFWVTEAGSVFLLADADPQRLQALVRSRLPAPHIGGASTTWRTCPFQPENGYGAIRVDYDPALTREVTHG